MPTPKWSCLAECGFEPIGSDEAQSVDFTKQFGAVLGKTPRDAFMAVFRCNSADA